ncbi:MAG: hypothetical protein ACLFO1_05065 [Spirochaetaceae bacterium]
MSSAYKRYIELLFERGGHEHLAGRYAASLSTSIHFYDHTAHTCIRAVGRPVHRYRDRLHRRRRRENYAHDGAVPNTGAAQCGGVE